MLALLQTTDLASLGLRANEMAERLHPGRVRTYNVERNINYTNICVSGCKFCAFCRDENANDAYVLDDETLLRKVEETVELGGRQILLQGGLHPTLPFAWYEKMLQTIKRHFPNVNIHGFSPTEIAFFADHFKMSDQEVLERLQAAGLGSLPGGGAEILVDRVRQHLSPKKATADRWLGVCRTWHRLGGKGSATMMFGHIETDAERLEHLTRIRDLQEDSLARNNGGGFTAFIPWTFQPGNTTLAKEIADGRRETGDGRRQTADGRNTVERSSTDSAAVCRLPSADSYLRFLAVSRLFLTNIPTIQSSWVTQGLTIGTLGLSFGANDLGSIMIEENVVAAAGTVFRSTEAEFCRVITEAGFKPQRRKEPKRRKEPQRRKEPPVATGVESAIRLE